MNHLLSVSHLNVSFKRNSALHDISFTINKGEIIGLVGPNGAGKTTIMKALLGLLKYQSGDIDFASQKPFGALIESPGLYPFLTGQEHLELFMEKKNPQPALEDIVSMLDMQAFINKKVKSYSLGMRQRLGIALAMLNQPELIILDEPLNGLDPEAAFVLRQAIQSLANSGTTFLISSHIISELEKLSDKILVLKAGHLAQEFDLNETQASLETAVLAAMK